MNRLWFFLVLASAISAASFPRSEPTPDHYTVCGGDRGYTEADSLEAIDYLSHSIVSSDHHFMAKKECIYAHVNTTIVSLCNGNYRDRHVTQSEVKWGFTQLIKDCGLEGGFSGAHVINNLTWSAFGDHGGTRVNAPEGGNPPDVPGGRARGGVLADPDDCPLAYNGISRLDCPKKNKMNEDGSCGEVKPGNQCQVFCELRRTGFFGMEQRLDGEAGGRSPSGVKVAIGAGHEVGISNGFSINAEGVIKEVIGLGVTYEWSMTEAKSVSIERTADETAPPGRYSRWVYFPKYVESCGTLSQKKLIKGQPCIGMGCNQKPDPDTCEGDVENVENVCSMTAKRHPDGAADVDWTYRFEWEDGAPLPMKDQPHGYKELCKDGADPDGDGENECMNPISFRVSN
ncbi:hypothetical protein PG989_016583 [Apiospora arundinis]